MNAPNRTTTIVCVTTLALHLIGAGLIGPKKGKSNTDQPTKTPPPVKQLGSDSAAMQVALETMGIEALKLNEQMNDGQNDWFERSLDYDGWKTHVRWSIDSDGAIWMYYQALHEVKGKSK